MAQAGDQPETLKVGWLGRENPFPSIFQPSQFPLPFFPALCRIAGCRDGETRAPKPLIRSTRKQRWRSIENTSKCSSSCQRTRGEDPLDHPLVVSVWPWGHLSLLGVGCSCWTLLKAGLHNMTVPLVLRTQ